MQLVEQAGGAAAFFQSNITVDRDGKALIDAVISSFGRLDYAFNNAPPRGPLFFAKRLDPRSHLWLAQPLPMPH